jgi:hypothetical protein
MLVNVLVTNVVTLHPLSEDLVVNLKVGVLYTYHKTSKRNGIEWIFIDQANDWYPKLWFKSHDLNYN